MSRSGVTYPTAVQAGQGPPLQEHPNNIATPKFGARPPTPVTILVVGPPLDQIGGMASVVAQMLDMDFSGRYRLEFLPFTIGSGPNESWYRRVIRHLRQIRNLQVAIRRSNAKIVHLHTCSGISFYRSLVDMMIARRAGCRVILHVHGAKFDAFYRDEPSWRQWIVTRSLRKADRVIALSTGWREKLRRMSNRAEITVIENAVDLPSPAVDVKRDGPCHFVLLARMDAWKGIDDLLDACALLRGDRVAYELTLAGPTGTAGDQATLAKKIRNRDLHKIVRYVGPLRGKQKLDLLNSADAYVQPSHHEGMPIALLEALAHGLPVVATSVGAVPEVIEHDKHGLLAAPHNPNQLAQAMSRLATDHLCRERFSQASRSTAANRFGTDRFRDDLAGLYDGITPV